MQGIFGVERPAGAGSRLNEPGPGRELIILSDLRPANGQHCGLNMSDSLFAGV